MALLYDGESTSEFVDKLLCKLPGFVKIGFDEFLCRLGKGWPAAEAMLEREIGKLLEMD
jgi:hypothetical protein